MNGKYLFAAAALISLMLCGCSDKEEAQASETTAEPNNYTALATDTTVTGEVISITGNEVTLALGTISDSRNVHEDYEKSDNGEPSDIEEGEAPDFGDREPPDFGDGEAPDFGDRERPDFGNGEAPDFGDRELSEVGDGEASERGGKKRNRVSIEQNGEEAVYIIPVGMTVDGLSGRSADYSGITVGMVLTLTVNSDGVVCAASVE